MLLRINTMDDELQQQAQPQPQPGSQPKKKKQLNDYLTILSNKKLISTILVNILGINKCRSENDNLWQTIKSRWNIQNDNHKASVLRTCNKRISSKEFHEQSEKASTSSKHNTNPTRVVPHGYRGKKPQLQKVMASGELSSQLYEIKSERSRDYVMGRRSKNESGSNIIPPKIHPIVEKLVDVQAKISKGDLVLTPREDLLTNVIGPEHPGRIRAVGHDIGTTNKATKCDHKFDTSNRRGWYEEHAWPNNQQSKTNRVFS
ncbi:unnamed protein product [Lactuca saligna]|uniref:Uncharacterized protein n=1 Tax=Lactuca saligna TaxID=75948 RepID=A0AA35VZ73_LACSI|nr:unnamed protein product [Lactuca saligna]